MGTRRTAKIAEAIRQVVSSTILFELRDPRIQHVTVLGVEVATDLRSAKVRVSVMGDESQQRLTMQGLRAARGLMQGKVGGRLNVRFVPVLSFEIDDGVKKSAEASRILRELADERDSRQRGQTASGESVSPFSADCEAACSDALSDRESSAEARTFTPRLEQFEECDEPRVLTSRSPSTSPLDGNLDGPST